MASYASTVRGAWFGAALLATAVLMGCASPSTLVPDQSTAADVRNRVGRPTDIRFAANGDELWEYATGPKGTETYLVRMGKDGKVLKVTQLLTEKQFGRIQEGKTTKAEVRDLLGQPADESYLPSGLVWEWRVNLGPQEGFFAVRFDQNGIVSEKMVLQDSPMDGGDSGGGGKS